MPSNPPRKYAQGTSVVAEKTRTEIDALTRKYGSQGCLVGEVGDFGMVEFVRDGIRVRFVLPLAANKKRVDQAEHRRRWRALFLVIKARLEGVASGVESFEEAFLSHVVVGDGTTVGERMLPQLEDARKNGVLPPLLPGAPAKLSER